MNANDAQFLPFLGTANAQFVIPVYQRLYSWTTKDCETLWVDIMRAGKFGHTHFIGSMLYAPEAGGTLTGVNRYLLIDGQQRMTTLTLLLSAFIEYLKEDESRADFLETTIGGIRRIYLFNDEQKGDARYKLVLSQDDQTTLFSIVGDVAQPEQPSQLIVDNYQYFKDKMREKGFDAQQLWVGLKMLLIVDTKLGEGDNAQLIFESMNSKGKPLTAIDLIRNFMLMSLPSKEQTRLYESYWHPMEQMFGMGNERIINEFFWNWLWLKIPNRQPKFDEVYDEFKLYIGDNPQLKVEEVLIDLKDGADHYTKIFLDREKDPELAAAFRSFNRLGINAARLLLMELYAQYEANNLTKDDYIGLIRMLESFLFRRSVCGRLTTGLNHYFSNLAKQLESQDIVEYITANLLLQDENKTAYFPTDEYFEEQFKARDCYNRFRDKCVYYLERIENWHHPKEPISGYSYQVEHVLPQTIDSVPEWQAALGDNWEQLHERYCNSLGNLTLTGYNQEYSNKPYDEKLHKEDDGLLCSPLYLNSVFASEPVWNVEAIERRAAKLMADALKIWPRPQLDESTLAKYTPSKRKDGTEWTIEEHHTWLASGGPAHDLFETLRARIAEEFPSWTEYVKKYYVGYRVGKRRQTLSIQARKSGHLVLGIRKHVDELKDPKKLCVDKRATGGIGPGMPTMVVLEGASDIDDAMEILRQV